MRLRVDQLAAHLARGLAPAYLISGDEPLQTGEAADAVRRAARHAGYTEREVFDVQGAGFDWTVLRMASDSLSLFAERRVFDLRLASAAIGAPGSDALSAYAANPPPDTLMLVSCPRLDQKQAALRWVKALDGLGALVQVWPVERARLGPWIEQRMRSRGLVPEAGVVPMLAERIEGNLLAAAQEIDKLLLLNGPGVVSAEVLADAVADSARFDVFALVDAALEGRAARCLRMLDVLNAEGVPEPVVLWALAREIRELAGMAYQMAAGGDAERVLAAHRVWDKRKPAVRAGLDRLPLARWQRLLQACAQADRVIKGRETGDAWRVLGEIALGMAGVQTGHQVGLPPSGNRP